MPRKLVTPELFVRMEATEGGMRVTALTDVPFLITVSSMPPFPPPPHQPGELRKDRSVLAQCRLSPAGQSGDAVEIKLPLNEQVLVSVQRVVRAEQGKRHLNVTAQMIPAEELVTSSYGDQAVLLPGEDAISQGELIIPYMLV